jgi:phosphoribosyl 1,2-cyclic phosphodiesterase
MRFCSLGSGSTGNAMLVEAGHGASLTRVLIDCGFTYKELDRRLARIGLAPTDVSAAFITHEHGDHIGCALTLARRHGVPLWTSQGTRQSLAPELDDEIEIQLARDGEAIAIGALELKPYTVPHDAREPLQLTCSDGARRLGVLTDAGSSTPHMLAALAGCDALVLECNHDQAMLAASRYPPSLKARVAGRFGHLANDLAAQILSQCMHPRLQHVVAAHLSLQNNRPELAAGALAQALGTSTQEVLVATAHEGFAWLSVH